MFLMISNRQYWLDRIRFEKRCSLGMAMVLLALVSPAQAQQPPADPRLDTYRQLLSEANDRLAQASAQIHQINQQVEALRKQLAEKAVPEGKQ